MSKKLSFVIPCYRSEKTIEMVIAEIKQVVSQKKDYEYEIICVNDGSPDNVGRVLDKAAAEDKTIKVIHLVKNVGKSSAVLAGYKFVDGDYVVNLDDDSQCPTDRLWDLLYPIESEGYDCSTASYKKKKESLWKRGGSYFYNRIVQQMFDLPKEFGFENFFIIKRFVADEMVEYKNPFPYISGLILQITRNIAAVPMEERERGDENGSGFTLKKSLMMFSDNLTAFSIKPLRVASMVGILFAFAGFIYGVYTVLRKIFDPTVTMGYSSILAAILFSSGMIMLMLGIIGEYIGRIYICINRPPQYMISYTKNLDE